MRIPVEEHLPAAAGQEDSRDVQDLAWDRSLVGAAVLAVLISVLGAAFILRFAGSR